MDPQGTGICECGGRIEVCAVQALLQMQAAAQMVVAVELPGGYTPSQEEMDAWVVDGRAEAVDGCRVELGGVCEHGSPSWLLHLGLI
jgi:hypothetical protein